MAALAIVMLMSCLLTGCTETDPESVNEGLVDTSGYACIKVYGVKEESTTDEAIAAVEDAINTITLREFKTKVKLMLFTEDKYLDAIDETMKGLEEVAAQKKKEKSEARAEAKRLAKLKEENYEAYKKEIAAQQAEEKRLAEEKAKKEEQMQAEAEAAGIEYIPEIEIPEHAIDVLLVRDINELKAFKSEGLLKTISEQVTLDYKKIGKYIHPTILDMGRVKGSLCAVVNNTFAGEAQYAVFNTELYEKYAGESLTEVNSLTALRDFLEAVKANETDVMPLANTPEFVQGSDFITDITNPIGIYNPDNSNEEEGFKVTNLFSNNGIQAHFNSILTYRNAGLLANAELPEDAKWAVKFVTGDEYTKKELEEQGYTVLMYSAPRITDENCNFSYYAVYNETNYESRALSFLELLTTDKELQTIFAYGIEGVNYELVDGKVKMLNDTYSINKRYMGNRFIGYPMEDEPIDIFEVAIERNQTAVVSALYGQNFNYDKGYIQEYTIGKVNGNIQGLANDANAVSDGEDATIQYKFKDFVNGEYVADETSAKYLKILETYCINNAVNGSVFAVSPYIEEKDGFYAGSTTKSKYDIETELNAVVKANTLPADLVELMKTVSAAESDDIASKILTDEATGIVTYYAVAPIRQMKQDDNGRIVSETTGLVCATTQIEDTMTRIEEILAEYWTDISTGIPDSSIDRFAMKIVTNIEQNAGSDKAAVISSMLAGISEDEAVVKSYTTKLLGYYNSYNRGSLSKDKYCESVKNLLKADFANIWNMWDEITDMNTRFTNETNITSLIEILNKQYA